MLAVGIVMSGIVLESSKSISKAILCAFWLSSNILFDNFLFFNKFDIVLTLIELVVFTTGAIIFNWIYSAQSKEAVEKHKKAHHYKTSEFYRNASAEVDGLLNGPTKINLEKE
jgi:hypothetical protein